METITALEFVNAFNNCLEAYNLTEVHVNLLAIELGVSTVSLVQFIKDNPSICETYNVTTSSGKTQGMYVYAVNEALYENAILTAETDMVADDDGGDIVVTPVGGEFDATEAAKTTSWIFDAGTTALVLSSIVISEAGVATLTFTETAVEGTVTLIAKPIAMKNGNHSRPVTVEIPAAPEA